MWKLALMYNHWDSWLAMYHHRNLSWVVTSKENYLKNLLLLLVLLLLLLLWLLLLLYVYMYVLWRGCVLSKELFCLFSKWIYIYGWAEDQRRL